MLTGMTGPLGLNYLSLCLCTVFVNMFFLVFCIDLSIKQVKAKKVSGARRTQTDDLLVQSPALTTRSR